MSRVWVNGTLMDKTRACVSVFDHGLLYGDGVWEHLRIVGGEPFDLPAHLDVLSAAAAALGVDLPLSRDELAGAVRGTIRANDRTSGYVRIVVTRGPGTLGPDPRKLDPQVVIVAEEYHPFPVELYGHGLHVVVYPVPVDIEAPENRVRSLGRPHIVLAKQYALRHGCLEAVLTDRAGGLVGTTEGMLLVCRGGTILPAAGLPPEPLGRHLLPGESLVSQGPLTVADLLTADEAFIVGTTCGVIGVVRVDGRTIGGGTEGPITRSVRDRYYAVVRGGP